MTLIVIAINELWRAAFHQYINTSLQRLISHQQCYTQVSLTSSCRCVNIYHTSSPWIILPLLMSYHISPTSMMPHNDTYWTTKNNAYYHKQNCRFLQRGREPGDRAEEESIARLTEALREAKPLKVAITNWRKDGTAFRNLLAIKPIMDQNGDYVSSLSPHFTPHCALYLLPCIACFSFASFLLYHLYHLFWFIYYQEVKSFFPSNFLFLYRIYRLSY